MSDSESRSTDLLALRIRNLIAAREFNTATANRELQCGDGWLCDHGQYDRELANEIDELFKKANKRITPEQADNEEATTGTRRRSAVKMNVCKMVTLVAAASMTLLAGCNRKVVFDDKTWILRRGSEEIVCDISVSADVYRAYADEVNAGTKAWWGR